MALWPTPGTPTAHAASHADGGSDEVTPAAIGAATQSDIDATVTTHEGASDPHPGYLTQAEGDTRYYTESEVDALISALSRATPDSLWAAGNAEAITRLSLGEAQAASGELWVSYFTAPVAVTISALGMVTGQAGGSGVTLCRLGLFTAGGDDSLTLVARTDDDTTIATAAYTTYERAMSTTGGYPASYTLTRGSRYAFGFLQVATTPTWLRIAGAVNDGTPPVLCRRVTGQTDIAASYAIGVLVAHFNVAYQYGT